MQRTWTLMIFFLTVIVLGMFGFRPYRGPAAICNWSPIAAGMILVLAMPIAVAMLSGIEGTFSIRNPALYLGDTFGLAPIVAVGCMALRSLPDSAQRTITGPLSMALLTAAGYILTGGLTEWLGRWQADQRWRQMGAWSFIQESYSVTDVYHFLLMGPVAAACGASLWAIGWAAKSLVLGWPLVAVAVVGLLIWLGTAWWTGEMMKTPNGAAGIRPQAATSTLPGSDL